MTIKQDALRQAWGLSNSIDEIPQDAKQQVVMYLAYLWGTAMNYSEVTVPQKLTKDRIRSFCIEAIYDLSFNQPLSFAEAA
jgi:hypothetical protein